MPGTRNLHEDSVNGAIGAEHCFHGAEATPAEQTDFSLLPLCRRYDRCNSWAGEINMVYRFVGLCQFKPHRKIYWLQMRT